MWCDFVTVNTDQGLNKFNSGRRINRINSFVFNIFYPFKHIYCSVRNESYRFIDFALCILIVFYVINSIIEKYIFVFEMYIVVF